jgi:hypothetical protein
VPDVAVSVAVPLSPTVFCAAAKVTVAEPPGIKVRFAGVAVTPIGKPLIASAIEPEKPSDAAAVTWTGTLAPAVRATFEGESVSAKSGAVEELEAFWPEPHEISSAAKIKRSGRRRKSFSPSGTGPSKTGSFGGEDFRLTTLP